MNASARDLDLRQHHGVETPEHVDVRFELAGFGSRLAAGLLDILLLMLGFFVLWMGGATIVGGLLPRGTLQSWVAALLILFSFCLAWGYFTLFEALNGGRTPGKQALGIRVVMDTGRSLTSHAAVVRNLVRFIDCFFPPFFFLRLLASAVPARPARAKPGSRAERDRATWRREDSWTNFLLTVSNQWTSTIGAPFKSVQQMHRRSSGCASSFALISAQNSAGRAARWGHTR